MRGAPCCGLLLALAATSLRAGIDVPVAPPPLTVLLDYDRPVSLAASQALASELTSILSDSNINVTLRLRKDIPEHSEFRDLVLFRMKGTCSMQALPIAALSDERGPLALTHEVNGELLPFGEVECDRVRQSLQRTLGRGNPQKYETQFGIALARVMAHELYHMKAHSASHTKEGVTKAALSSEELSTGKLMLPPKARTLLQVR